MTLPDDWARCQLEDLLPVRKGALVDGPFGSALKSEHYTSSGCRVIRLNNVGAGRFIDEDRAFISMERFNQLRRHSAEPGDLVTAALGDPPGRTCIVPEGLGVAIVKADCFRTRLHPRVSAPLITYWLNSPELRAYFQSHGKGVGRIRFNLSVLRKASLPLPPEREQALLVEWLNRIYAHAENARHEATLALTNAEALKASAIRAGVSGELTAAWRAASNVQSVDDLLAESAPVKQPRGGRVTDIVMPGNAAIALNDPATPLPDGWRWVPLLRLARQETGHTPRRSRADYWGGDIDWLGIKDARDHHGTVVNATSRRITAAGLAGSSARILPARTVCLSRTASVGYVTILGRPMATSQDFVTWTCGPALSPEYLMYALMAEGKGIRRFGRGSTHSTIYFPELRAFTIALPPLAEQRLIIEKIKRVLLRADELIANARKASLLADTLVTNAVTQAMSGRIRHPVADDVPAGVLLEEIAAVRQKSLIEMQIEGAHGTRRIGEEIEVHEQELDTPDALVAAIKEHGGRMRPHVLWQASRLPIDRFYHVLRPAVESGRVRTSKDKDLLIAD
jgi:type I restriction enzyme S subunit